VIVSRDRNTRLKTQWAPSIGSMMNGMATAAFPSSLTLPDRDQPLNRSQKLQTPSADIVKSTPATIIVVIIRGIPSLFPSFMGDGMEKEILSPSIEVVLNRWDGSSTSSVGIISTT